MAKPTLKAALTSERRTNRRLRVLLDETTEQIRLLRRDLDLQFIRIAELQAQVDAAQGEQRSRPTDAGGIDLVKTPARRMRTQSST